MRPLFPMKNHDSLDIGHAETGGISRSRLLGRYVNIGKKQIPFWFKCCNKVNSAWMMIKCEKTFLKYMCASCFLWSLWIIFFVVFFSNVSSYNQAQAAPITERNGGGGRWGGGDGCPRCGKTVYFAEEARAVGKKWHKMCLLCGKQFGTFWFFIWEQKWNI